MPAFFSFKRPPCLKGAVTEGDWGILYGLQSIQHFLWKCHLLLYKGRCFSEPEHPCNFLQFIGNCDFLWAVHFAKAAAKAV